jgi:hypothetical protein
MKAQTSMEFVILMTFMILVFTAMFLVVQNKSMSIQRIAAQNEVIAIGNVLKNEADLAFKVQDGYMREFWLPDFINGREYTAELVDKSEIVVTMNEENYLIFLTTNVSGFISKGYNTIIRHNRTNITIYQGRIADQ